MPGKYIERVFVFSHFISRKDLTYDQKKVAFLESQYVRLIRTQKNDREDRKYRMCIDMDNLERQSVPILGLLE